MGTWGSGILQDDTVADVLDFVTARLKAGQALDVASAHAQSHFSEIQRDEDEAPLLWLAIAEVQWKYGVVDPAVLSRVRGDIESGRGLDRWRDDAEGLASRKAALARFLAKVAQVNPKPSALPKTVRRPAPFQDGDCLSVQLPDGQYTAALVLRTDNSNTEIGKNLVASLDYLQAVPPSRAVFELRDWLVLRHGKWTGQQDIRWFLPAGFQKMKGRIKVVGNVNIRRSDPTNCSAHAGWNTLGDQILLARSHGGKRKPESRLAKWVQRVVPFKGG